MTLRLTLAALVALALGGCGPIIDGVYSALDLGEAPYYDLGRLDWPINTSSPTAQLWFERGMILCYGFNHEEATRCFERALEADPDCIMAYWGIAYAAGPNINNTAMDAAAVIRANEHIERAESLQRVANWRDVPMAGDDALERGLVAALATRYSEDRSDDRAALDKAYAAAMRDLHAQHHDPHVAALFAESLMVLRPWNHFSKDGTPAPETPEIVAVLEKGLADWPEHPALCHFYIHVMEASPTPEKALPAANRLRDLVPGAGHLVHMPSHIDVHLGRYRESIEANLKAIAVDSEYVERVGGHNFYTLYRVHNYHFVVYSAMFDGQSELALEHARELVKQIPESLKREWIDFFDAFLPTDLHVLVRFGRWEEILLQPAPAEEFLVHRAVRHYARCLAYATTGRVAEAEAEQKAFAEVLTRVPDTRILFNNSAKDILSVAEAMMDGELAYRKGDHEQAFASLREAVKRDDAFNYDEPWGWMQPARHALGALLLEQGKVAEASAVYRADLERHPENAWSLHGLAECLQRQGQAAEAAPVEARLAKATSRADVRIEASCYCRIGEEK